MGMLRYGLAWSMATLAGVGMAAGAVLALPGAFRKRVLHPSFGLWIMLMFGNVDWLGNAEGPFRWILQADLLAVLVLGGFKLRDADWRLGAVAAAALAAITSMPIGMLVLTETEMAAREQWRFGDAEFAGRIMGRTAALRAKASVNPDIYLVVADRYPSPKEAVRRGSPYPAFALAGLRENGWRIRHDASTDTPSTVVTMASTFALATGLTNGGGQETRAAGVKALYENNQLNYGYSFANPLLLEFLKGAGYETWGWIGWWLLMNYVPFDRVDKSREGKRIDTLHEVTLDSWAWIHSGGRDRKTDPWRDLAMATERNCRQLTDQRERFFAFQRPYNRREQPLFMLYHVLWFHDVVNMDEFGSCVGDNEAGAFDLPAQLGHGRLALCRSSKDRAEELLRWAPSCLPDEVRAERAGKTIAYLPAFLSRLERHARRVAMGRPFRIVVVADEGFADAHWGADAPSGAWRDDRWIKHPAVFRATFAEGRPSLWVEEQIPDMPQAMREVVLDLLR